MGRLWIPSGTVGCPWGPFGRPVHRFGSLWNALGLPVAGLWHPLGRFGAPWAGSGLLITVLKLNTFVFVLFVTKAHRKLNKHFFVCVLRSRQNAPNGESTRFYVLFSWGALSGQSHFALKHTCCCVFLSPPKASVVACFEAGQIAKAPELPKPKWQTLNICIRV